MAAKKAQGGPNTDVYQKLFKELDKDGNGYLSMAEFEKLLDQAGSKLPESQKKEFFNFFDGEKGDSRITFEEFTKGLDMIVKFVAQANALFKKYDKSGDGFLDRGELKKLLNELAGETLTDQEVDQILDEADVSGDGKISLEEFVKAFC